jgi:hypothetical protein
MFRVPSICELVRKDERVKKREVFSKNLATFFSNSGKDVDDDSKKILAGSLSLIGKLFEIYFVRLIGTPNQNSKMIPV